MILLHALLFFMLGASAVAIPISLNSNEALAVGISRRGHREARHLNNPRLIGTWSTLVNWSLTSTGTRLTCIDRIRRGKDIIICSSPKRGVCELSPARAKLPRKRCILRSARVKFGFEQTKRS